MSFVVIFTLTRFVLVVKFFELPSISPLRNKGRFWAVVHLFLSCIVEVAQLDWGYTNAMELHDSSAVPRRDHLHSEEGFWWYALFVQLGHLPGDGSDMMKSISFSILSHFCRYKLWPIVTNQGYRDTISGEHGFHEGYDTWSEGVVFQQNMSNNQQVGCMFYLWDQTGPLLVSPWGDLVV